MVKQFCHQSRHFFYLFSQLFTVGGIGSPVLRAGFFWPREAGPLLWASTGPRAQGLQQPWSTGLAALRHMGLSRTRGQTRVPCVDRQMLNPWATMEVQGIS